MNGRSVLLNAFQPATELEDPDRFAGRAEQVRVLADALHVVGSAPLIYGDRGLGKSSLAHQIRRIAMGDVGLLADLGAERLALPDDRHYLTFYVTCTDSTKSVEDLLQLLVNSAESVDISSERAGVSAHQLVDRSTRKKLTLKVFEIESTKKYQTESQRLSYQDLNLEEKLVQLCELLVGAFGQPVLFIVDEVDRMGDTQGLASFIKAASSEFLKFVIVGIASTVSDLLSDHQSLERRLTPVKLPLMKPAELGQIVTKAERHLRENGFAVSFEPQAISMLAAVAAGFPWFVHVLGQQSIIDAERAGETAITRERVVRSIDSIVSNQFAQQFSDMYQNAVRDSMNREVTLRAFAEWRQTDIPTGEVYRILERELNLKSGSTYRGHLCTHEYGSVLFAPAFQSRGLVRFRNEMFKAYVRLRPSIYEHVDSRVREAYAR